MTATGGTGAILAPRSLTAHDPMAGVCPRCPGALVLTPGAAEVAHLVDCPEGLTAEGVTSWH